MDYMTYEEYLVYKQIDLDNIEDEETKEYTKVMYKNDKINYYKDLLNKSDYKAIKYSEGLYTDEEYEPIKQEREQYREKINELEEELAKINA